MKKLIAVLVLTTLFISCGGKDTFVQQQAIGKVNRVLVVTKSSSWLGDIGKEVRAFTSELMVGLPQDEPQLTISQVAPEGFSSIMKVSRNILIIEENTTENFTIKKNKYAAPQMVVYISAKDKKGIIAQLKKHGKEIVKHFKDSDLLATKNRFAQKKLDLSELKTLKNLNISFTIPENYRTVEDTLGFLWLRQHLLSGIARNAGSNNILIYSLPLTDESKVAENIVAMRDTIGKKYIPGSAKGMYMITEEAYTPFTIDAKVAGNKAFETRGKWEVKNDFMAGPFINYTIIDKKNNRLLVFEGFTYAPSVNKREFIFELEAIAKSMVIN